MARIVHSLRMKAKYRPEIGQKYCKLDFSINFLAIDSPIIKKNSHICTAKGNGSGVTGTFQCAKISNYQSIKAIKK